MAFFSPEASLVVHHGKLPHWRQEGAIYFVTFHLADSLPRTKLEWLCREKELWLRLNPEPTLTARNANTINASLKRPITGLMLVMVGASWRDRIAKLSWNPAFCTSMEYVMNSANLW